MTLLNPFVTILKNGLVLDIAVQPKTQRTDELVLFGGKKDVKRAVSESSEIALTC
jgi:hypothetical protein